LAELSGFMGAGGEVEDFRRRKMRKRRAARMASAMGMPTPTPTLRPKLELDLPLLLLRIAAALPDIVVSFAIIKEKLWRRPTLTAHSYGYC
jgi:hypothetical protein